MTPETHSEKSPATDLRLADHSYIDNLKVGDRLFHFPRRGDAERSFRESPSAEHTLYSVIGLPDEQDVTLIMAFDKKESRKNFSRDELLSSGDWWYNPAG
ncbi:MAG TPA: hypothetical protein VK563_10325 [Puia sp.]|nr:hypothetical protein [Puia sp.]